MVGAGIFGAAGALSLARRGHRVTLIDPGPVPHPEAASTDISKLVRLDYGTDVFYTDLMERALVGWRTLNDAWDRPLFHETGVVVLSSEPLAAGTFERDSLETLAARGHDVERLEGPRIRSRFPAWSARYVAGYFNPQGGWAEAGEVTRWFVEAARDAGAVLRSACATVAEEVDDADLTIVAAGAWTPLLVPELACAMRVVAQPIMHFAPDAADVPGLFKRFSPPDFVPFAADIGRTGWYGFCSNAHGIVKIANHGPGVPTDPAAERALPAATERRFRVFLRASLPGLATARRVVGRLCLYCDTFDGDFWIARHPTRERLMVASGGSGHAFKFAPILGDLIADEAEGKTPTGVARRFGWREPRQRRFEDARSSDADAGKTDR